MNFINLSKLQYDTWTFNNHVDMLFHIIAETGCYDVFLSPKDYIIIVRCFADQSVNCGRIDDRPFFYIAGIHIIIFLTNNCWDKSEKLIDTNDLPEFFPIDKLLNKINNILLLK